MISPDVSSAYKIGLDENFVKPMAKCDYSSFNLIICVTSFPISEKLNWKRDFVDLQIYRGDLASLFKRKSCSKHLQKFYEFHCQDQVSCACLFNLIF